MTSPTDLSLTIEFRYHPGGAREASLLEAYLPNGAKFVIDLAQVHGKLGANLMLFCQAAAAAAKPEGKPNCLTAKAPEYDESMIVRVAPGAAYGVKPPKVDKTKEEKRRLQDLLDSLEVKL